MHPISPESQKWLEEHLARARTGSAEDFDELVRPFRIVLRHRARKRMERRLQAKFSESDIVQLTILKAFEDLQEFRGATFEEFADWLFGILDHTISEEGRKYHRPTRDVAREISLEQMKDELAIRQAIREDGEQSGRVKAALQRLPELHRQVIHWRYFEDFTYEEIGLRIGRTADATKHLCQRVQEKLAEELCKQQKE